MSDTSPSPGTRPRALVVYESMFGNTRDIAESIATGLAPAFEVDVREVSVAEPAVGDVDLLVVGGPVHAFSLSRPATRADALRQAEKEHKALVSTGEGMREWLGRLEDNGRGTAAAAFDTVVRVGRFTLGSAARAETRALRARGFREIAAPEHFQVEDTTGPLKAGERDRATAWAQELARRFASGASSQAPAPVERWRGRLLMALTGFGGITALGGGLGLLTLPPGSAAVPPLSALQHTPFTSFLIPGLLLMGLGGVQLAGALSLWRRAPWALALTVVAGGGMVVWIVVQAALLRELNWLHVLYFSQGAATLGLAAPAAWRARGR